MGVWSPFLLVHSKTCTVQPADKTWNLTSETRATNPDPVAGSRSTHRQPCPQNKLHNISSKGSIDCRTL